MTPFLAPHPPWKPRKAAEANRRWATQASSGVGRTAEVGIQRDRLGCAPRGWLKRNWPQIRRAVEWLLAKDTDSDGIIDGNQHNTLDTDWFGPVAWLSGEYLAALAAGAAMATEAGDTAFADRCRGILDAGRRSFVDRLFDGEYFVNRPDPKHPEAIKLFTGEIKKIAAAAEVDYGQEWLQRFSAFIGMLKLVGLCIGSFLLLATIFIISNTIKLTIYSRREEIEIMKLVGATNLSIRIPFFLEGITHGLLASLLSLSILYGGYKALVHKLIVDYSLFLGPLQLTFLPPQLMAALVLLGIALGIFGCAFSMGRFLKV